MASSSSSSSSPAALQSISIPRSERRTLPTSHIVYAIVVRLPVRTWTVYRRYSEFVELHQALSGAAGGSASSAPPAPLPPKESIKRTWRGVTASLGLGGSGNSSSSSSSSVDSGSTPSSSSTAEDPLLQERRLGLERYLRAIVTSPEPRWREAESFRDFIELPRTQSVGSLVSGQAGAGAGEQGQGGRGGVGHRYVPGSYAAPSGRSANTTRQLGTPSAPPPAHETAATLQQSSSQLYASQQAQFDRQDAALEDLTAVLRRQRQMGMAINQELTEQTELLEGLDGEVRETQAKLGRNEKQIKRLG